MDLGGPSLNFDSENFVKQFYIPSYILVPEAKAESLPDIPECPVLVFINSRSGGQLGGDLLITYRSILNENQVFDLGEKSPDSVLRRIFLNLERLKNNGDEFAPKLAKKLRIIVAGGDGTAGWLLGVVSDLKLSQPPPIATVPLGTGNNLPFSFGWGKKNPGTDRNSVLSFLEQVKAKEMKIDSWHILMRMRVPKEGTCEPIAPLELPHSLHAFHRVSSTDDLNVEGYDTFRGGFWNYFSMDDGLLEIVGFKDAWHGLVLLAPNGHGTRLAQAHRIRFEFHKGAADATYMRIDGEPWKQPLPVNDETVEVEISNLGQVTMLATHDCRSNSVFDPSSPVAQHDEKDSDNEDESTGEEWRKFGAAETFKIPDEVDISQLS
ncbi:hypothetical protein DH2020_025111 [Rehmannia glutinosa]|uniref:diacylglycerol kinase (ATP) n=1 Tax=Rehmannia glutinosa TaxID=99300 RepID=A0ABR0W315_REHGL